MRGRFLTQTIGFIATCAVGAMVCAAAQPATRPALQHVPDEPSQARAQKMVREVYAKELQTNDLAQRRAVAQKLVAAALATPDDPAVRFVLLKEAREASIAAGDAFGARRAIALTGGFYAIDQAKMILLAMTSTQAAASPEGLADVVQICLSSADQAVAQEDFTTAAKLLTTADSAAAKAKNPKLIDRTKERAKLVVGAIAEFESIQKAREALKRDADDPEAAARIGRFMCLYKGDWNAGLPLLAKGADSPLKKLAEDDLAAAADPRKRAGVGDQWWDLGATQAWLAKKNMQARAAFWYRQVVGEMRGFNRSIFQTRIETVELAALAEQNLAPGLGSELYKDMEFKQLAKKRVDDQINFDWGAEAPDAAVGKDNFAIRWSGVIRPPAAGDYDLLVQANSGVRLWVDEKLVLDNPNLARARNGVRVAVKLQEPLHPIRVEFWDAGGIARMKLFWRRPGAAKEEIIPASAFFHEGLVEGP